MEAGSVMEPEALEAGMRDLATANSLAVTLSLDDGCWSLRPWFFFQAAGWLSASLMAMAGGSL